MNGGSGEIDPDTFGQWCRVHRGSLEETSNIGSEGDLEGIACVFDGSAEFGRGHYVAYGDDWVSVGTEKSEREEWYDLETSESRDDNSVELSEIEEVSFKNGVFDVRGPSDSFLGSTGKIVVDPLEDKVEGSRSSRPTRQDSVR